MTPIPELTKDKYIGLALVILMLAAYIVTRDGILGQLLPIVIGGEIALLRSGSSTPPAPPEEKPGKST